MLIMERHDIVLAALAAGAGAAHKPIQVQRLLFLIDREISDLWGGPQFNLDSYHFGPFDKYRVFEQLESIKLVEVIPEPGPRWNRYKLTDAGQARGESVLSNLPEEAQSFIREASTHVRKVIFADVVMLVRNDGLLGRTED